MTAEQVGELVARAQRGHTDAVAELYTEYAPAVSRYFRRQLGCPDAALVEDLTADVFLRAFQRLDRYVERPGAPFAAWLYRLARNYLIDYLRAQPRRAADSLEQLTEAAEVADLGVPRDYGRVLDHLTLGPALARLGPDQRRAVELRFLDGLSTVETARIMGKTEDGVKKLQSRGLAALRRMLDVRGTATDRQAILAVA